MVKLIITKDFSRTPGPRFIKEGDYSGELFRKEILFPKILDAINRNEELEVDLDGTAGIGTSFLEESFGGLIRIENLPLESVIKTLKFISNDDPSYIEEILGYINDAYEKS